MEDNDSIDSLFWDTNCSKPETKKQLLVTIGAQCPNKLNPMSQINKNNKNETNEKTTLEKHDKNCAKKENTINNYNWDIRVTYTRKTHMPEVNGDTRSTEHQDYRPTENIQNTNYCPKTPPTYPVPPIVQRMLKIPIVRRYRKVVTTKKVITTKKNTLKTGVGYCKTTGKDGKCQSPDCTTCSTTIEEDTPDNNDFFAKAVVHVCSGPNCKCTYKFRKKFLLFQKKVYLGKRKVALSEPDIEVSTVNIYVPNYFQQKQAWMNRKEALELQENVLTYKGKTLKKSKHAHQQAFKLTKVSTFKQTKKINKADKQTIEADKQTSDSDISTSKLEKTTSKSEKTTNKSDKSISKSDKSTNKSEKTSKITDKKEKVKRRASKITDKKDKVTARASKITDKKDKVTVRASKLSIKSSKPTRNKDKQTEKTDKQTEKADKLIVKVVDNYGKTSKQSNKTKEKRKKDKTLSGSIMEVSEKTDSDTSRSKSYKETASNSKLMETSEQIMGYGNVKKRTTLKMASEEIIQEMTYKKTERNTIRKTINFAKSVKMTSEEEKVKPMKHFQDMMITTKNFAYKNKDGVVENQDDNNQEKKNRHKTKNTDKDEQQKLKSRHRDKKEKSENTDKKEDKKDKKEDKKLNKNDKMENKNLDKTNNNEMQVKYFNVFDC